MIRKPYFDAILWEQMRVFRARYTPPAGLPPALARG
jgi:hypothetical protein